MITKSVLLAQRDQYVKGRADALANLNAFGGAIDAIDQLLGLLNQQETIQAQHEAAQAAKEQ